jgi:hypothetical protein
MNQLKKNRENLSELRVVEMILRSLTSTLENIVCEIEESKDLTKLSVDKFAGSHLAHE